MSPEQLKKLHALILKELGIESLPPTVQEKIIAEIGQNIFMATQVEIMTALPSDQVRQEYMRLVETNKPAEATKLLEQYIPNLDQFVANVATKTLQEFKALDAQNS